MKRSVMWLAAGMLFLPTVFVMWLLLAVRSPKMDTTTMHMPMGLRQLVAQAVAQRAAWDDRTTFVRVVKLDPKSAVGWDGLCSADGLDKDVKTELENCKKAVALADNAGDEDVIGKAKERLGDSCAAAEAYRKAWEQSPAGWIYPEHMGEAALDCGNLPMARTGLETAVQNVTQNLTGGEGDDDDKKDARDRLSIDREFLIVVYDQMKQPQLADAVCKKEHAAWKGCACAIDEDGDVDCSEKRR